MRKAFVLAAVLCGMAGLGAPPAGAEPPPAVPLPAGACNEGTMTAHHTAPEGPAHAHIPMDMGMCMTMPAGM
ncbi:MAG TPA: hypothetical protein VFO65_13775 [Acidimicrobiales bacterium]|nr:hypothetical protein [Acidimicrobiales bacterium]